MKYYRFKNEREMVRDFGKDWRKTTGFGFDHDKNLGKDLSIERDAEITNCGGIDNLPNSLIVEINPISAEVEKVYIDEKKGKVTVIMKDGREGRSACSPEDIFDPQVGFALAYTRAVMGSATQYKKYIDLKMERLAKKNTKKDK